MLDAELSHQKQVAQKPRFMAHLPSRLITLREQCVMSHEPRIALAPALHATKVDGELMDIQIDSVGHNITAIPIIRYLDMLLMLFL